MLPPSRTVLVTGASGLLGSHVVDQLLREGYSVRASARSGKVAVVKATFPDHAERLEVITIEDVVTADVREALKDVFGVIHVASPVTGRKDTKTTLNSAIRGTRNILEQAIEAGVKHLVVTSSQSALWSPHTGEKLAPELYTPEDWNEGTEEAAVASGDIKVVYDISKALAEKVAWELADKHPDVEITTLNLPFLLGPLVKGWPVKPGDSWTLTSNGLVFDFLNGVANPYGQLRSLNIHLRTAAWAHVRALTAPPTSQVGRKRLLLAGEYFTWKELAEYLREVRPELTDRLPKYSDEEYDGPMCAAFDTTRVREVLGLEKIPGWKEVLLETVDDMLRLQKEWEKAGWQRPKVHESPY